MGKSEITIKQIVLLIDNLLELENIRSLRLPRPL